VASKKQQLAQLRASKRKDPKQAKRRIGTLNVATGVYKPRFPDFMPIPARAYDRIRATVTWLEAAPSWVDPPEGEFERVFDAASDFFVDWGGDRTIYVAVVTVATKKIRAKHVKPGDLVVLLEDDDLIDAGGDEEFWCVLTRGKRTP
jgi:hypothetical protein